MNTQKKELSIEDVAARLGVSERSIVNYLRTRRIEGIKVGKKWFINAASVDAFIIRYGFSAEAPQSPLPETLSKPSRQEYSTLPQLHLFQLCREVFASCDWEQGLSSHAQDRIRNLKNRVLEEIGAGFHSFGVQRKSHHYNTARAQIGAMLAILHSQEKSAQNIPTILLLEKKTSPRFFCSPQKNRKTKMTHSIKTTKVFADAYAMTLNLLSRTRNFPKHLRPTLGRRLEDACLDLTIQLRLASFQNSPSIAELASTPPVDLELRRASEPSTQFECYFR